MTDCLVGIISALVVLIQNHLLYKYDCVLFNIYLSPYSRNRFKIIFLVL